MPGKDSHFQRRAKTPEVCPLGQPFRLMQCGSFARSQHFDSGIQQQQSSNVGASQTLGSGRSGAQPPREEIACAGRPVWAPCMGLESGAPRTPARTAPTTARQVQEAPEAPALANAAGSAALRNGTDGATAAVVSSEHKVARLPRNKQLSTSHHFPCHHFTTSLHAPNHPNFLTSSQLQFLSKTG